ncbi:hypothetical protein EDD86DRAFT_273071 [Gorgonomyces haynaldii]|nr:hypothetical protein EDD86DRAFT_273071 [Gorgonomyces haynaldii]
MHLLSLLFVTALALPAKKAKGKAKKQVDLNKIRSNGKTPAQIQAKVGNTVTVKEDIVKPVANDPTSLQFRIAVPTNPDPNQLPGINVLLHGDGGQSFFEFPNAQFENNLIGVAVLAPNAQMRWGGTDLQRTDGPQHATLVAGLIKNVLPQMAQFDPSKVFFTGVSGGALTLTSAMLPLFGNEFPSGMLILCGGLPPAGGLPAGALSKNTRIHFQTTQSELDSLKTLIPQAIASVQDAASQLGLSQQELDKQFTVDGTPQGGHCAFDGQAFNSGIQAMVSQFGTVMFESQAVPGITGNQLSPLSAGQQLFQ